MIARTDESELSIIFPGSGAVTAQVAMRLARELDRIASAPVDAAVAVFPEDGRTGEELLAAARAALEPDRRPAPVARPAAVAS